MTNIVTRKGIAFGALVALASTAIAGAPAHAAGELNVVPSAGTSYTALEGTVFNLKTTFAPGFTPSSYAQLKYQIKTDANSTVSYGVDTAAVTAPATSVAVSTTTVSGSTTGASATSVNYLGLKSTTASATTTVEVTAFVDANNDGALTAGEWNTVKSVTFKKVADLAPVVTVAAAATGDTTATATVNWGDLNVEQISAAGAFGVATGSTNSSLGLEIKVNSGSYAAATWSSSTSKFTKSVSALVSGDVVSAQAVYATNTFAAGPTNTYSSVALGAAATATASARTINTSTGLVANLVKGNDAIATSATTVAATTGGVVRTNGSFTVSVVTKDTASTPAVKAGVAVTGSVSGTFATALRPAATGVTEISVTVNGTKYTTNATLAAAAVALTTDASGVASLNISSTGLAAGDSIVASFAAQNLTASVATTQTDAAYTVSDDNASTTVATNKNTAATLSYSVKDQFGILSARTNERLVVSATNAATATQYIAVTAGKATFSVTPATDSTATVAVTSVLQVSTNSNGTITWANNGTDTVTNSVIVRSAAYSFSTAPAVAEYAGTAVSTSNASQTITQVVQSDSAATGYVAPASNTTYAKITLTGSNAGEALTVTGSGVYLSIDGAAVTADKATKVAQAGAAVVYVASNTVGTKTITITNGTVSATVDVVFASAASAESTATTFAVAVAAAAQSGRAIDATVTVTDKWGNPVAGFDVTASVSGVAVVNGGFSANATTDAAGKATVKLSAGVNDLGDAVVTFSDNDSNTSTNVTSVAKTVTFGSTDGYIDVLNGKRASVTWSFAKGKRVAVYLDGVRRYNIVQPGDSELNLQFNLKKGSHSIKLVIGGVIVDTLSVKVAG
jgi:trimeric autotransporter adhesin